jgi:hypothetical protein
MIAPIKNIDDLRTEISRLRGLEREQSTAISKRFSTPSALFSTLLSLFPKSPVQDGEKSQGFFHQDIVGLISRFILPFTLNKTIFRHSNFIIKTLVGIVSQRVSHFITEDSLIGLWEMVKSLFKSKTDDVPEHRAIPALSETY